MGRPLARKASLSMTDQRLREEVSVRVPSSQDTGCTRSWISMVPPGVRLLGSVSSAISQLVVASEGIEGGGGDVLVALLEESRPVLDRPCHESRKDEIKGLGEGPVVLNVIDEELHIRRHAIGG